MKSSPSSAASARLHGLDTLRGLAILAVVLFHVSYALPEVLWPVIQFGWMGVDLFFVLSGFLIGSQLLREHLSTGHIAIAGFYRRRAFRILPAYFVVLTLYRSVPQWREFPGLAPWWKFASFTENLLFRPQQRAFSHVWSLCVEEHFYLVLPLLALWLLRRPSSRRTVFVIATIFLGGIALRAWATYLGADYYSRIYYPTWMRLDGLLAGVVLALLRTYRPVCWRWLSERGHITLLTGLALVIPVMFLFRDGGSETAFRTGEIVGFPLLSIGLGFLVSSAMSNRGLLARWRIPGAEPLALLAFSLYLSHKAVVHVIRLLLPAWTEARDLRAAGIYAAACLLAAILLYLAVERPFLRLRDRSSHPRFSKIAERRQQEPAT